jgi:phospholipid transport system substrate-binding protein
MKRIFLLLSLFMFGPVSPAWADVVPPDELVKDTSQRMIEVLRDKQEELKADPGLIYSLVDQILLPHFDFVAMSRLVLGKHWKEASREQRKRFVEEFRTMLVRTYASALNQYHDQEIEYLPVQISKNGKNALVRTEVKQGGSFPIPINYRLRLRKTGWKVFDVTVDGISLVTNYRSSFGAEIRKSGIGKLIAMLEERNKE